MFEPAFDSLKEFEKEGKVWSALQRKGVQEFIKYLTTLSSLASTITEKEKQRGKERDLEDDDQENPFVRANTCFQEVEGLLGEMGEVVGGLWATREALLDSCLSEQFLYECRSSSSQSCLSLQNFVKGMAEGMRKIATLYENELQRKEQILSSIDVSSFTDDDFVRIQMEWESEACLDKREIRLFFITHRSFLSSLSPS